MLYEIEQAVFERFPGYARMVVVAEGVDNTREIPELAELLAQCAEDGSDEQGRKKAEGHGSQRINQVGLHGDVYIFSFQKLLDTC